MGTTARKARGREAFFAVLFGGIFVIAGLAIASFALDGVVLWARARNWEPADAEILQVELRRSQPDSDGDRTYAVRGRYRYAWQGDTYTSDRIAVHNVQDDAEDWHRRLHGSLSRAQETGTPVTCYVNPGHPAEAVINRELRWGIVLVMSVLPMVFIPLGATLAVMGIRGSRKREAPPVAPDGRTVAPWQEREDWARGEVVYGGGGQKWTAAFIAVFWNLVTVTIAVVVLSEALPDGDYGALIVLLFPLIGVGLIGWAVYAWRQAARWGTSRLQLTRLPGVLGGTVEALLHAPPNLRPQSGFRVVLQCVREYRDSDNDLRTKTLWQDTTTLATDDAVYEPESTVLPIYFEAPYDLPESTVGQALDVNWRLAVRAQVPGIDYSASFEVPVVKTEDSNPELTQAFIDATPLPQDAETSAAALNLSGVRIRPLSLGTELYFPALRFRGTTAFIAAFTAIWWGIVAFLITAGAPLLFPIAFGFFGVLFLGILVDMCLRTLRVRLEPGTLTVQPGWLGRGKPRTIPVHAIKDIKYAKRMSSGERVWYDVQAVTPGEKRDKIHTIAKSVEGRDAARAIRALAVEHLGWEGPQGVA